MNHFKPICFLIVIVLSCTTGLCQSYRHAIGVNFLRITDLTHQPYVTSNQLQAGLSTTPGLTYSYKIRNLGHVRLSCNFDRKRFRNERWSFSSGSYNHIVYSAGIVLPYKNQKKSPFYLSVEGYGKYGNANIHSASSEDRRFVTISPYGGFASYDYRMSYSEVGVQLGLGKSFKLSDHISIELETAGMFGKKREHNLNTNKLSKLYHAYYNPMTRFSLNYSF